MNKTIGVKKGFTLVELMVVMILISTIYFLAFSSFRSVENKEYKVKIENLKQFLYENFEYDNSISLICVEEENFPCFVFVDDSEEYSTKIQNLFSELPRVYDYGKDSITLEFLEVKIEDISYKPFFVLSIDKDKKHKNLILEVEPEKVYLIKSILSNIKVYNSIDEILEEFNNMEVEVKDAL